MSRGGTTHATGWALVRSTSATRSVRPVLRGVALWIIVVFIIGSSSISSISSISSSSSSSVIIIITIIMHVGHAGGQAGPARGRSLLFINVTCFSRGVALARSFSVGVSRRRHARDGVGARPRHVGHAARSATRSVRPAPDVSARPTRRLDDPVFVKGN